MRNIEFEEANENTGTSMWGDTSVPPVDNIEEEQEKEDTDIVEDDEDEDDDLVSDDEEDIEEEKSN